MTLPGLGALLVHGVAPVYDRVARRWHAPGRVVSFNPDIVRTDGLLAGSIARREGMSHEAASRRVEAVVAAMRAELNGGNAVAIGRVGTISPTDYGTYTFAPAQDWSLHCASTMWLPDIDMTAQATAELPEVAAELQRRSHRREILNAAGRAAACIGLLIALAWVVVSNLRYGAEDQYASIVPVQPAQLIERPGELDAPIVWMLRHHDDASVAVEPKPEAKPAPRSGDYCLVVASLANMREAEGFMAAYPGVDFGVLQADGRYRVYAATAATAAELYRLAASESFSACFPSSWVCKK